ncbi:hypothetical protein [Legionella oakridgensis]|uniref:Uncharacterized protein n=2 Tax=Legionella oakridgensis TaxID=29423 RepID=W0BBD5_9GAMM|nr:hypothetical protein [Legionella oakridgensis]AHE67828.1 hypothetical protein Loa_02286 [Legionella oakridgensis ATCC 33761 = DSM 21215]KTD44072.1 hypothetical protein Loak_0214 [Legionella oakridgensis]STY20840.1 Uncharacterised protein [Legionella longbeachae]
MTWAAFFKSRSFKYGALIGGIGFAAGAGGSAAVALKLASLCSTAVNSFVTEVGTHFSLSELSAVVHIDGYNATLTLDDINAALPPGWLDIINHAQELPSYCFSAPFTIGLCITAAASLALASTIAIAIHIHDHPAESCEQSDAGEEDARQGLLGHF